MVARVALLVSFVAVQGFSFTIGEDKLAKENRQKIAALQRMIAEQNERIDGLTSLLEGLNASVAQLKREQKRAFSHAGSDEEMTKLVKELGAMIDKINREYVSRSELRSMLKSGTGTAKPSKEVSAHKEAKGGSLDSTAPSKLYSEGVRLFVKKRYDEAKKRFLLTAKRGYKPAASNYYLGEIAYYTKVYDDALFYYKKSAGLYDGASYMPVLLLHTGVSLERLGKKEQAKIFYENVTENYPGTKAASIANKRLRG